MKNSAIAWCDHTFNPWLGCEKVSRGCKHCYAETFARQRMGKPELWRGERQRTKGPWLEVPKWNREAAAEGVRRRVFVASLADIFEDRPDLVPWRADAFDLIRRCPNLDFLLLTKRPGNIAKMLPADWSNWSMGWPNVWLGTTVESDQAEERALILADIPALVRFVSYEPAVGPLRRAFWLGRPDGVLGIDWLIYGGESGQGRIEDPPEWAADARSQCEDYGAAFFFKQNSAARSGFVRPGVEVVRQFPVPVETVRR
jgi:protein gp37